MNSTDLAIFERVARLGGVTRAAADLHTVQSNVTARLQVLERELGVPLFYRHHHGVTLTSAGEALLPYAARIGVLLNEAQRAVADRAEPKGPLRVGSLETTAARRLPPVLTAYSAAFPAVDLSLHLGTTAELVASVLDYRLEGALVAGPVDHPALIEESVIEEELVMVTSPTCAGSETFLRTATGLKILVLRTGCSYRQRLEAILAARGAVAVRVLEFGMLDALIGCAAAGIGITLLPRAVVEAHVADGRVAVHTLPPAEAHVTTVFIRRKDAFVSAALKEFVRYCKRAELENEPASASPQAAKR